MGGAWAADSDRRVRQSGHAVARVIPNSNCIVPVLALLMRLLWAAVLVLPAFGAEAGVVLTPLHAFNGTNDGANPEAGLVQGSDGSFYGTTSGGGTNGYCTVFKISTNGVLTTLYSFGSITHASGDSLDGSNPAAGLVQGSDGSFYGTTSGGGQGGARTVFRLTIVPEFQAVTLTNGWLNLTWSTEAGGTYQLQYNSDLSSSNWINLSSPFTATGATLSTTDSLTNGPQRFYRLVLAP
jgi:uncharacterized repeat protein (TIGR03803 family)